MKKFVFTLSTLLSLRKKEEERIMLQLAEKNREIVSKQNDLASLHDALKELQKTEKTRRSGLEEPVDELRSSVAYRFKLKNDILTTGQIVQELQAQAEKIRIQLTGATQARKALEQMKEQRYSRWKKESLHEEQRAIDDMAQQRSRLYDR